MFSPNVRSSTTRFYLAIKTEINKRYFSREMSLPHVLRLNKTYAPTTTGQTMQLGYIAPLSSLSPLMASAWRGWLVQMSKRLGWEIRARSRLDHGKGEIESGLHDLRDRGGVRDHPQTLRLYEREGLLKPSRSDGLEFLHSREPRFLPVPPAVLPPVRTRAKLAQPRH